jgi:hypothetical protein
MHGSVELRSHNHSRIELEIVKRIHDEPYDLSISEKCKGRTLGLLMVCEGMVIVIVPRFEFKTRMSRRRQ